MFLNKVIEILSRSTPQMFCFCYHRKTANKLTVISKLYCISKLLAELGLSNSKSKTNSKATHCIEEIIPANISYCWRFDLNITELDESLPIIYWLPKIHKTPVGVRFIVASYYCSTNPLSDKISKMIFNTVKIAHKSLFYSVCQKGYAKFFSNCHHAK